MGVVANIGAQTTDSRIYPLERQVAYHTWERGMFFHFGILTFYQFENSANYGKVPMEPPLFNPTSLDCDQWAAIAKECGFNYMVLTVKHHDGFCLWPSKTTDYSVASSQWKGGEGDVVREFVEACRKYDLKVGLYYSPYDIHEKSYETCPEAYDEYFTRQMEELLSEYGKIDILWFDGANSDVHRFNWEKIVSRIRTLQPEVLLFNSLYPDIMLFDQGHPDNRWVGNEDGYADLNVRNVINSTAHDIDKEKIKPKKLRWLVPECDIRMREHSWFYRGDDAEPVKSVDELISIYYSSCGRGCNLLLNIGPDQRGLLPEKDVARLREFCDSIQERFGNPFARFADCSMENGKYVWSSTKAQMVDHVIIGENIANGERVNKFIIEVETANTKVPVVMYEGSTIGYKRICRIPSIRTRKVWIRILEADGEPEICKMDLCYYGK